MMRHAVILYSDVRGQKWVFDEFSTPNFARRYTETRTRGILHLLNYRTVPL